MQMNPCACGYLDQRNVVQTQPEKEVPKKKKKKVTERGRFLAMNLFSSSFFGSPQQVDGKPTLPPR